MFAARAETCYNEPVNIYSQHLARVERTAMICAGICRDAVTPENVGHWRRTIGRLATGDDDFYSEWELLRLDLLIGERRLRQLLGRRPTDLELARFLLPGRSLWGFSLTDLSLVESVAAERARR